MFHWKPKGDNQPVPVHQVQHWLNSAELYHLPLNLKGFQLVADIEEIPQPFLLLGKEEGQDGRNYILRTRLLYVCFREVYTAAVSVSLSVVTGRISVSVHLLVHLAVWHLQCILDYLLKVWMLILKIKKLFSSAYVKWESANLFACQFLLQ